jgi:YesN/AraC family two-component response regulator
MAAKKYLVSSEMNISDISFLLGYSEPGYFCKIFKKYEKMTPSAFCHTYVS